MGVTPHPLQAIRGRFSGTSKGRVRFLEKCQLVLRAFTAEDGVAWIRELGASAGVAPLGALGVVRADFEVISDKACRASSMAGNPVVLSREDLCSILTRAL